jgi:hypothetical protein
MHVLFSVSLFCYCVVLDSLHPTRSPKYIFFALVMSPPFLLQFFRLYTFTSTLPRGTNREMIISRIVHKFSNHPT